MANINDLRSALELLQTIDEQYVETDVEVDPNAELSGVYRYVGAGGTVSRPTREGPAMVFNNVKGHPDARVAIGVLASRKRVGYLLDEKPENLGKLLNRAVSNPIPPVVVDASKAQCQEVVHYATEEGFDIRKLIPAPTNTEEDAGPYITMGLCYASDPETKESDITIHRLCLQSKDEISMYFVPGTRHLGVFREKAEAMGKPLPISISVGVDPAIEIAACFEPPTTPLGYNELGAVVSLVAVPQCIIFLILFFASTVIFPLTSDVMIADFKACGGFIMLATGFRMIKVKMFPIADMVPAMILVMPISALWVNYIMPLVS